MILEKHGRFFTGFGSVSVQMNKKGLGYFIIRFFYTQIPLNSIPI